MENRKLTDAEQVALAELLWKKMKLVRRDKERNSGVQEKLSFARPILCKSYASQVYPYDPPAVYTASVPDKDGKFTITVTAADGTVYPIANWEEQEPVAYPGCGGAGCFTTTDGGVIHKMGCSQSSGGVFGGA